MNGYQILMGKNNIRNATKEVYLKFMDFEAKANWDYLAIEIRDKETDKGMTSQITLFTESFLFHVLSSR